MNPLKWFLNQYLKRCQVKQKSGGFTLIELLVAIVLAALVITPLMGFMINVMDSDRKEQAKATSEQEIKAALDYISQDLEQAIYIYDAAGIEKIKSQLPTSSTSDHFPVIVFWKRQFRPQVISAGSGFDDTFVYSLVAYYFIKGDDPDNTWSKAARIGRFEIREGQDGFQIFDPNNQYTTLKDKMENWTKSAIGYTNNSPKILPLVDYIDQTTVSENLAVAPPSCPADSDPSTPDMQQVPNYATGATTAVPDANLKTGSFYVCVLSSPTTTSTQKAITVSEVHLRGNAYARIENDVNKIKYSDNKKNYFPQYSARVKGRGFLYTK
ncbi:hormogonium polysaccharide secretion pseudopilin HpsC [Dendronalium sp. ChiSLP03b]|uniref:hormogonium polysaccharide secretion pseudopilin HpsC n=1 Tax=Dendronalium sp. ChiSLP03b TaxID=3075381 RepID=UPI002AD472B7|nr:hormogonium polysaccharide secretion pseudopilin HpsC [Dendronalium sp. ChiSLP03b]MDZ8203314.1 hormogonium polysaccharide secretion pseudopilin HpsC [Dendronalium sp. ChiSLP03b]